MESEMEKNPWIESGSTGASGNMEEAPPTPKPNRTQSVYSPGTTVTKVSYIRGKASDIYLGIVVVNFHHTRGPEIEYIKWNSEHVKSTRNIVEDWPFLPFQALPDGAHSFEESFSVFSLDDTISSGDVDRFGTVFAISCTRQIKTSDLLEKESDVTRSSVQKSIVILLKEPIYGIIHDKLSIVTKAYFEQRNFKDRTIIDTLHGSLSEFYRESVNYVNESDFTTGLEPQDLIKTLQKKTLIIVKAMILEKRVVLYSKNSTRLCNFLLCMASLIPNLINNLHDCASPSLNTHRETTKLSTSFQSSNRNTVLEFAGMPLQIFGSGGVFNPYCPLQQLDELEKCTFYTIGSSNAMIANMKSKISDVFVNIDTSSVDIISDQLNNALCLSNLDKKWMDHLMDSVIKHEQTTDFKGSDDYIRLQFEDYLLGMVSTIKFETFLSQSDSVPSDYSDFDVNQVKNFNEEFVKQWKLTKNYETFNKSTDDHIFDIFEPRHIFYHMGKSSISSKFQEFYKKTGMMKPSFQNSKSLVDKDRQVSKSGAKENTIGSTTNDFKKENETKNYNKLWTWHDWKRNRG